MRGGERAIVANTIAVVALLLSAKEWELGVVVVVTALLLSAKG
jgi:hypothetical protein